MVAANVSRMADVCADRQPRSGNLAIDIRNATSPVRKLKPTSKAKSGGPTNIEIQTSESSSKTPGVKIRSNNRPIIGSKTKQATAARKATIKHKTVCRMGFGPDRTAIYGLRLGAVTCKTVRQTNSDGSNTFSLSTVTCSNLLP